MLLSPCSGPFQSLLIQLGVKEVLMTSEDKANSYDIQKLKQLIERCNIVVTERKKSTRLPSTNIASRTSPFLAIAQL